MEQVLRNESCKTNEINVNNKIYKIKNNTTMDNEKKLTDKESLDIIMNMINQAHVNNQAE